MNLLNSFKICSVEFQALRNRDDAKNFVYEMAQFPEVKVTGSFMYITFSSGRAFSLKADVGQ